VLATYARSCYLDLDGHIVALVGSSLSNGPLNVVLDAPNGLFDRMVAGVRVSSTPKSLDIGDGPEIMVGGAVAWDAGLSPWRDLHTDIIRVRVETLRETLAAEAPDGGLARAAMEARNGHAADRTPLEAQALPSLVTLSRGLGRHDPTLVSGAAQRLAGLGPGLTPSGDDVLAGALIAGTLWPTGPREAIRGAIVSAASGRTTRISAAYLDAAARGEASEAWHTLVAAIPAADTFVAIDAARRLMAFGETSGSDMLAGFLLAVTAFLG